MTSRKELVEFLNKKLDVERCPDMCVNGLQVEGGDRVTSVAVAVDAGQRVIEKAISAHCELLIVHHGIFWEKPFPIVGAVKTKIGAMLAASLNLYAVHLPLDAHPDLGNNFCLARLVGLSDLVPAIPYRGTPIGCIGNNSKKHTMDQLCAELGMLAGARTPFVTMNFGKKVPERVCVVTGAGADALYAAEKDGFDTLITGEPRQFAYHFAEETKLNVICAGHYATETVGVQELGKLLEREFKLPWQFIDEPTGI